MEFALESAYARLPNPRGAATITARAPKNALMHDRDRKREGILAYRRVERRNRSFVDN